MRNPRDCCSSQVSKPNLAGKTVDMHMRPPMKIVSERILALWWCAIIFLIASLPASPFIIIPEAKTIGANHYEIVSDNRAAVLGSNSLEHFVKLKAGIGQYADLGVYADLHKHAAPLLLWNAKYTISAPANNKSAFGLGFSALGSNSTWSTYVVDMHKIGTAEMDYGLLQNASGTGFFIGIEGNPTKRVQLMIDYVAGHSTTVSLGARYYAGEHWSIRLGEIFLSGNNPQIHFEIKYSGMCKQH